LSRGEKRNRKRMATVATVYTLAPQVRTAEAIMGREDEPCAERARVQNKRVWASLERDPAEVTEEVFQGARRRDPEQRRVWAMLVDGHKEQLKHIRACMRRHLVGVILILDFVHVLEYLWRAAYCFHAPGTEQPESRVAERALQILRGHSSHVAAGMRRSATLRQLLPKQRQAVDECANCLLTYKDLLKYDEYLAQGLPIATGVIEGACRHLVKDRMDLTGARWGLQRAEAVLKLRSLASSGDESYWEFYKAQALRRNHATLRQPHATGGCLTVSIVRKESHPYPIPIGGANNNEVTPGRRRPDSLCLNPLRQARECMFGLTAHCKNGLNPRSARQATGITSPGSNDLFGDGRSRTSRGSAAERPRRGPDEHVSAPPDVTCDPVLSREESPGDEVRMRWWEPSSTRPELCECPASPLLSLPYNSYGPIARC
jgi:hypothetical protein